MKVRCIEGWEETATLAGEWNALSALGRAEDIFLSFEWYDALRSVHGTEIATETLVLEDAAGIVAIWPLHRRRTRMHVVLRLAGITDGSDWYLPHAGIATRGDPTEVARSYLGHLVARADWDVLVVNSLIEGGTWHRAFVDAAKGLDLPVRPEAGERTPYLPLEGSWNDYLAARGKKLRLKRCQRSMETLGEVRVQQFRTPVELTEVLPAVVAVEEQSWKQDAGTALTARDWEYRFYRQLLQVAGPHGWAQVTLMYVDGRPVAHDIGLVRDGRYVCLKTSFVESIRSSSPGRVLREFIVRSLYERGFAEHDFLGKDERWKMLWTDRVRPHVGLMLFRTRLRASLVRGLDRLATAFRRVRPGSDPASG